MVRVNIHDNKVDNTEYGKIKDAAAALKSGDTITLYNDQEKDVKVLTKADFDKMQNADAVNKFIESGSADSPSDNANKNLGEVMTELKKLKEELEKAEKNGLKQKVEDYKTKMRDLLKQAQDLMTTPAQQKDLKPYYKAIGEGGEDVTSGKAQVTLPGGGQASSGGTGASAQQAGAAPKAFYPPTGWAAQTLGGSVPGFTTDTYMKSMAMSDDVLAKWDDVNTNTNRGKQLMMLFFYFAKMAESGDMGAMYQFMKFITYIISKDKAKQQIEMGKKLIEMQELSRSWTNRLMNVSTNTSDPNASNNLMKEMTLVKSETDAIATSQKLLSQMMEEFAQVVETLTNVTKTAGQTYANMMRTVSRMNG